ncbi:ribosomal protein S20 [Lachnoanaerobaculum saburreum]|uniref:Small ribosomal subunit protein bS20 n=1 Tax=Lachnoanaerobaculum saburreum TaxID=467210 RepID=A0A133ZUV5_9FIRM|nr:ribosomal protein S20 [Lachnoanaerobaculum saburreum]
MEVNVANIKSAKKRIQVTLVRTERNKAIRSKVKTAIKKVESAVAANDKQLAKDNLKNAIVEITKAASKGVYHKNNASRKVARLSKAVDSINA